MLHGPAIVWSVVYSKSHLHRRTRQKILLRKLQQRSKMRYCELIQSDRLKLSRMNGDHYLSTLCLLHIMYLLTFIAWDSRVSFVALAEEIATAGFAPASAKAKPTEPLESLPTRVNAVIACGMPDLVRRRERALARRLNWGNFSAYARPPAHGGGPKKCEVLSSIESVLEAPSSQPPMRFF